MTYRIFRMKDSARQQFLWAPHVSGPAQVKPKDYLEEGQIEADEVYAAWAALRATPQPLRVGDILATAEGQLRICKYVGFEEAHWIVPEPKTISAPGDNVNRNGLDRINSFAIVSYLPEPLGSFIDRLRVEIDTQCRARAHVTILPPRPIPIESDEAARLLTEHLSRADEFVIQMAEIEVFPHTNVIYLNLGLGRNELMALHDALNQGPLHFDEPYVYSPHVTLAQDQPADRFEFNLALAKKRWAEFPDRSAFAVGHLTFVQNTAQNQWLDLAEIPLRSTVRQRR